MKNKIWQFLTKNVGYKILAVLFAFLLWIMVYNNEDPVKSKFLYVNVTVTNASYLEEQDKYFEIVGGTNRISLSVSAPRSILNELDETDFTAVADLNNITISEDGTSGTVPIEVTTKATSDEVKVTVNNKICKLALENLMSKQFVISANVSGEVSKGHALGDVKVTTPTVLKVSGPESLVNSIADIRATIDVGGMSMNLTDNVVPVLLDKDGKEINTTRLTLSNPTVTISAEILKIKEVPIIVQTQGTPAGGYVVTDVSVTPEIVAIKGNSALLNGVTGIEIPAELVDVTKAKEDLVLDIDISEYLADGTELVDKSKANVKVVVTVEPIKSKNFNIHTQDIQVVGLAEGLELSFVNPTEVLTIRGLKKNLDELQQNEINLKLYVSDLGEGTHQVELVIDLDNRTYTYEKITVPVVITEIPQDTEHPENTEDTELSLHVGEAGTTETENKME